MSKLYPAAKEAFLTGGLNLETADIRAALIEDTYVYDDAHTDFTTDIMPDIVGTAVALTGMSVTIVGSRAVFDADSDVDFGVIAAGPTIGFIVLYDNNTGIPVAYIDDASGLPFVTNGGTIELDFNTGVNKIFAF